jgi:N-acetyl-anhydromuramyl-L-alanine amidase AmpD
LKISTELRLESDQYIPTREHKDLIVLHHTVGGTAQSTVDYWRSTPERIGTAYIVDRDGTVFEVFPPGCWARHLGLKGTSALDRRSIGIEIASEGALLEERGRLYAFGRVAPATQYTGPVFDFGSSYRGYRYFAQYTPAALAAVAALVERLLTIYSIPRHTPADHIRADLAAYTDYRGVLAHCHLRPDKTDVHPGFGWNELVASCQLEMTGTRAAVAVAAAGVR